MLNIGAYVIFGSPILGENGTLDSLTLNGSTGFLIKRVPSFFADVSGEFDINGDGIDDFIIRIDGYWQDSGYVIFGNSTIGEDGTLNLLNLNGINGFIIKTITIDNSWGSISSLGDVNEDGFNDIAISFPYAAPKNQTNAGSTYVIFGGPTIGRNGILELSSFNQTMGVIINGHGSECH